MRHKLGTIIATHLIGHFKRFFLFDTTFTFFFSLNLSLLALANRRFVVTIRLKYLPLFMYSQLGKLPLLIAAYIAIVFIMPQNLQAQHSEVGLWLGLGNYIGDLNPSGNLKKIMPAGGLVYRYTVNDYIALRAGVGFTILHHDDALATNAPYQIARNLDFRTNLLELSGQIDLHFKKFILGSHKYYWTPYLTTGIAVFHFNPKTTLNDETYNLVDIGTEGQQSDISGRKPYKKLQIAIPVGGGFKYSLPNGYAVYAEVAHRYTFTDYIDDVSTTYVDNAYLGDDPIAMQLSDRSNEVTTPSIGIEGKQRGSSVENDSYLILNVGILYTIFNRKCPKAKGR